MTQDIRSRSNNGITEWFEAETHERTLTNAPVQFYDDFVGLSLESDVTGEALSRIAGDAATLATAAATFPAYPELDDEVGVTDVTKPYGSGARYGIVGDGATDNSTAWANLISSARALGGVRIDLPSGTIRVTTGATTAGRIVVAGQGMDDTILWYDNTEGALLKVGSYDGAKDFLSAPGSQECEFRDLTLKSNYDNTTIAGRTGTPYGVVDYESGHCRLVRVRARGFYTFFWGIASDFNYVEDFMAILNGTVFDLKNRCDQATFIACRGYGNHTYFKIRGCKNLKMVQPCFIDNTGPDLDIGGSEETVSDPFGAGDYTGIVAVGAQSIEIDSPWFEDNQAWPEVNGVRSEMVKIGFSPSTAANRPCMGVRLSNVTVQGSGIATGVQTLVRTQYESGTCIDGISFEADVAWPIGIAGDGYASDVVQSGAHRIVVGGGVDVRRVSRRERFDAQTPALVQAPAPAPHRGSIMHRRSIISNPTLRGGATPFAWTLRASTTVGAYALSAGEKCLSESPIEVTASANLAGLQQTAIRLRAYTTYEVIIRFKTSDGSGAWGIGLNPDPSGAGQPSNIWQRQLQPQTVFGEYRFLLPTYDIATVSSPRLQLLYLGSTSGDKIIIDYFDVVEIAPMDTGLRGHRYEVYGTAAPTSGTWERGDVCWADLPFSGGPIGWVCTTAGTPGTWREFGHAQSVSQALTANSTTPSVSVGTVFTTANTNPTSITNFTSGTDGKRITIRVTDANTTFKQGTGIKLSGSVDLAATSGTVISFILYTNVWYETGRVVP